MSAHDPLDGKPPPTYRPGSPPPVIGPPRATAGATDPVAAMSWPFRVMAWGCLFPACLLAVVGVVSMIAPEKPVQIKRENASAVPSVVLRPKTAPDVGGIYEAVLAQSCAQLQEAFGGRSSSGGTSVEARCLPIAVRLNGLKHPQGLQAEHDALVGALFDLVNKRGPKEVLMDEVGDHAVALGYALARSRPESRFRSLLENGESDEEPTVEIPREGKRYHHPFCAHKGDTHTLPLSRAQELGYSPCFFCFM